MKLIQKFEVYPFNTLGYPFNTLDIKDNKWIIERLIRLKVIYHACVRWYNNGGKMINGHNYKKNYFMPQGSGRK